MDENIKPGYFELQEGTRENDTYTAEQTISAGYGMLKLPVTNKAELVVGARSETSDQFVEAKSPFVTTAEPVDVQLKDTDLLPAANLAYRFSERMNVRGGLSVTLSRPELREMSPFDMYDYETGYSEVGNPEIHSTRIENYDVRWEFFPGTRELLAVSGFRKLLYEPIENVVEGSSGGYILSPRNGRDGRLKGSSWRAGSGSPPRGTRSLSAARPTRSSAGPSRPTTRAWNPACAFAPPPPRTALRSTERGRSRDSPRSRSTWDSSTGATRSRARSC